MRNGYQSWKEIKEDWNDQPTVKFSNKKWSSIYGRWERKAILKNTVVETYLYVRRCGWFVPIRKLK